MQQDSYTHDDQTVPLDWSGLLSVILATPKTVLSVIAFIGLVLFSILGPFFLLPIVVLIFLTGPFRGTLQPKQRKEMNKFVIRANTWIDKQIESRSGLL